MSHQPRPAVIETIAAEYPKYTAPIVLVHGRWCTAAVWRLFMGYLAHLGWICHALTLPGHSAAADPDAIAQTHFTNHLDAVRGAIAACEAPPVVIGHDLGGLLALHCAASARAVIALAPTIPHAAATDRSHTFAHWRARLAAWRSPLLPPPDGQLAVDHFGRGLPGGTTCESAWLADELARHDLRSGVISGVPTLLVAGEADTVSPPDGVERLATKAGAAFLQMEGVGHALPWEPGWERRVTAIHRWLVQQLGEALLMIEEREAE